MRRAIVILGILAGCGEQPGAAGDAGGGETEAEAQEELCAECLTLVHPVFSDCIGDPYQDDPDLCINVDAGSCDGRTCRAECGEAGVAEMEACFLSNDCAELHSTSGRTYAGELCFQQCQLDCERDAIACLMQWTENCYGDADIEEDDFCEVDAQSCRDACSLNC
jgi:hypothetical protein